MLGSDKRPEEINTRDALLWMVSEGLSKEMAFELSNDKKGLPLKDQGTRGECVQGTWGRVEGGV